MVTLPPVVVGLKPTIERVIDSLSAIQELESILGPNVPRLPRGAVIVGGRDPGTTDCSNRLAMESERLRKLTEALTGPPCRSGLRTLGVNPESLRSGLIGVANGTNSSYDGREKEADDGVRQFLGRSSAGPSIGTLLTPLRDALQRLREQEGANGSPDAPGTGASAHKAKARATSPSARRTPRDGSVKPRVAARIADHNALSLPDHPWRSGDLFVHQRVLLFMNYCVSQGILKRPSSRDIAKAIGASASQVSETKAFKNWGKFEGIGVAGERERHLN